MNKKYDDKSNGHEPSKEPLQAPPRTDENDGGLTIEVELPPSQPGPKRDSSHSNSC